MTTFETKTATSVAPASTLTKNQIALQRGFIVSQVNTNKTLSILSKQEKLSIQAELMQFGYILSEDALDAVSLTWFEDIMSYLKKSLGVGNYLPFYKNFPKQVMELSHTELFMNAILHYWSEGTWEAPYELQERFC
jgi:hypothetical protein